MACCSRSARPREVANEDTVVGGLRQLVGEARPLPGPVDRNPKRRERLQTLQRDPQRLRSFGTGEPNWRATATEQQPEGECDHQSDRNHGSDAGTPQTEPGSRRPSGRVFSHSLVRCFLREDLALTKRYRVSVGNRERRRVIAAVTDELFALVSLGRLDGTLRPCPHRRALQPPQGMKPPRSSSR